MNNNAINPDIIKQIYLKANTFRKDILHMLKYAGSGHLGGAFSSAEIMATLYFHEMKLDPKNPDWNERDRFVLSKGHSCPVQYAALAEKGFFSKEEYKQLRHVDGNLQGHPERKTPGIEFIAGFLGQGLSAGLGMALGFKRESLSNRVYVLLGDGDNQEGQTWEAARFGAHNKLDNLVAIYDYNNLQSDDWTENILTIKEPEKQWTSFGWKAIVVDGHNIAELVTALEKAKQTKGKPTIIIAKTTKGKDTSCYANNPMCHGSWAPKEEDYKKSLEELDAKEKEILQADYSELIKKAAIRELEPQISVGTDMNLLKSKKGEPFEDYVFEKGQKISLRNAFGMAASNLAKKYDNFDLFDADVKGGTMTCIFEKHFPNRFIQCGIAEQNMMSVSAGYHLATGRIPIITTYGVFTSMLAAAQFRNNIAMQHLPVIVASSHVGIDTGPDGPTHQATEDLGIFRTYPGVTVLSPACPNQLEKMLEAALNSNKPVYMRTGRSPVPVLYSNEQEFSIGKDYVLRQGKDITLFSTGILVNEALIAADNLAKQGISAEVINLANINPLDKATIIGSVKKTGCALTIEDHYINNGVGGAISQLLSKEAPTRLDYIALKTYAESGDPAEMRAKYGLDAAAIEKKAVEMVMKK
jgi:transketolase